MDSIKEVTRSRHVVCRERSQCTACQLSAVMVDEAVEVPSGEEWKKVPDLSDFGGTQVPGTPPGGPRVPPLSHVRSLRSSWHGYSYYYYY